MRSWIINVYKKKNLKKTIKNNNKNKKIADDVTRSLLIKT